jgi:predicted metal-binding protein
MPTQSGKEEFEFLKQLALDKGAEDAKIIPAKKIVIENRVVLKCKIGCSNYGKTLMCPPYTPSAEEFRKIANEYRYALFLKFKSKAEADPETAKHLSKPATDPTLTPELKKKIHDFWAAWKEDKQNMLYTVIDLEKAALNRGYPLAIGLVSGTCYLCDKCNLEKKICVNPTRARYSEDAVGVNVKATAKNAGISVTFPFEKNPESFALVLID